MATSVDRNAVSGESTDHGQRLGCADVSEGIFRQDMFNRPPKAKSEGGNLDTGTLKTRFGNGIRISTRSTNQCRVRSRNNSLGHESGEPAMATTLKRSLSAPGFSSNAINRRPKVDKGPNRFRTDSHILSNPLHECHLQPRLDDDDRGLLRICDAGIRCGEEWDEIPLIVASRHDPAANQDVHEPPPPGTNCGNSSAGRHRRYGTKLDPWALEMFGARLGMPVDGDVYQLEDVFSFSSGGVPCEAAFDLESWREVGGQWRWVQETDGNVDRIESLDVDAGAEDWDSYEFETVWH